MQIIKIVSACILLLNLFPIGIPANALRGVGNHGLVTSRKRKQHPSQVKVTITKITGGIYLLSTRGAEIGVGNIGISAGADGILMIDTQIAAVAPEITVALKKLGLGKPRLVINTHWHGDHTGGNEIFGKEAIIIAQENTRQYLLAENPDLKRTALPIIIFKQFLSINFNGDEVKIIHLPGGHTDGDCFVYFTNSHVAHLGDLYKGHRFPGVDLGHGGNVRLLAKNIAEIIAMLPADVRIIPGHGELATLDDLKDYLQMLNKTLAIVEQGIKEQKTLAEIKNTGFPAEFESWNNGLTKADLWIEQIYKSLIPQPK